MSSPFLSIGFRPFYLGATIFAALSVPLWVASYASPVFSPGTVPPMLWHAHEMVFGFAPAVIVGFLLTAVRNWTGRPTPSGRALGALFLLWVLARAANLLSGGLTAVVLDGAFLLCATVALALPILKSRNQRNYFVPVLLLGLTIASVLHGLAIRGEFPSVTGTQATRLALDLILLLMVVIGGRVIPAFSRNAVAGLTPRGWRLIEATAIATPLVLLAADTLAPGMTGPLWQAFCVLAAVIHLIRLAGWQPWKTLADPLLLVLPLAYLWIPIHLLLRAFEPALAVHALTVGAMAGLMMAMMTRSALGHTGRPLQARTMELLCLGAVHLAALCRVAGPLLAPGAYLQWLWLAATLWAIGFTTFSVVYWPILTRPRIDA
jgi:uncharacterized protein involved in response to NO